MTRADDIDARDGWPGLERFAKPRFGTRSVRGLIAQVSSVDGAIPPSKEWTYNRAMNSRMAFIARSRSWS